MVKLLDYSRRTSGRAAVSRHQTEFVGFGIKVISFATHPISLSPMTRAGQTTPYHLWLSLPFGSFSKNRLKSLKSRVHCPWSQLAPKGPIDTRNTYEMNPLKLLHSGRNDDFHDFPGPVRDGEMKLFIRMKGKGGFQRETWNRTGTDRHASL